MHPGQFLSVLGCIMFDIYANSGNKKKTEFKEKYKFFMLSNVHT